MPDDAREILKAAGVECAEVDAYTTCHKDGSEQEDPCDSCFLYGKIPGDTSCADAAILALARLVARYKWQRDEAINDGPGYYPRDALDRRWEEHNA